MARGSGRASPRNLYYSVDCGRLLEIGTYGPGRRLFKEVVGFEGK